MDDKKVKILVIMTAFVLLISGSVMFYIFEKQGMGNRENNSYVNYNVNDYVEIIPVIFNNYNDKYSDINVSRLQIKNIEKKYYQDFINKQEEYISYITSYYNQFQVEDDYIPVSMVHSNIKTQINGAVLSIFYSLTFNFDDNLYSDNIKNYIVTFNIDLITNRVLTNDDLLSKYNYSKNYISDKLFNDEILINKNEIVIDKNTNITLNKNDIERKKTDYVNGIVLNFNNIIDLYIEDGSLVLVYDTRELKNMFFIDEYKTNVKFKYLK